MSLRPVQIAVALAITQILACTGLAGGGAVTLREVDETIPTYEAGLPDPNPMFYFGKASQGAEGRVYPYPLHDNLTNRKSDQTYRIVYLENEYIQVGIAPELGGRVFSGVDKTNGYNFFYRQHVIKPALIGLTGAWISGGIEWNIPHHHRASTFAPVQYKIEENPDGSKTVWVGELEVRHRTRWAVGYTVRPGRAYLEVDVRAFNRTPLVHTMLAWANVAVHVNEDYQVIFPPSTEYVTHHHKREFTTWPRATTPYGGVDWQGQDVSWFKNHYQANSMFAWNYWDDFLAGYDHGAKAGTMSVANHHVVPGKKLWTWGNSPGGRMWDRILTDADGPYIELMVGAFSDNQPDYSWLQPGDAQMCKVFWYPFRDIGGVKNANLEAATNLELSEDGRTATVGFNVTSAHPRATATLTVKGKPLLQEAIAISPAQPFARKVSLPGGTKPQDVRVALSVDGRDLVAYAPAPPRGDPLPAVVNPPPPPAEFKTNEELLLAGQRAAQFHSPTLEPDPFWQEALRRDPDDARVNTAYGIEKLKRMQYAEAEGHLRTAIKRLEFPHTKPKNAEPYYYLGLALKAQGRMDEAYAVFYKATWNGEWKSPAFLELARIDAGRGELSSARELAELSLAHNAFNQKSRDLLAAVLRHSGASDASSVLARYPVMDPLDVTLAAERSRLGDKPSALILSAALREHPQTGLELAAEYLSAGLHADAAWTLDQLAAAAPDSRTISPLVHYFRAYVAELMGEKAKAAESRAKAQSVAIEYAFPFQAEFVEILEHASRADSKDARARYLLGNLLFDTQPDRAITLWEESVRLDPDFAVAHRNLGVALMNKGDTRALERAILCLERAIACGSTPVYHYELDQAYEAAGTSVAKRLSRMESHREKILARDDSTIRFGKLMTFSGRPGDALRLLDGRFFHIWEGGARFNPGDTWIDAHLVLGQQHFSDGRNKDALAAFKAAMEFPESLRAEGREVRAAEAAYWRGMAHEALGEAAAAREAWQAALKAELPKTRRGGNDLTLERAVQRYHQGLSLQKLGRMDDAVALFREVLQAGSAAIAEMPAQVDFFSSFGERSSKRSRFSDAHYVVGLGHAALGEQAAAKREFQAALTASPDHLGAKLALDGK